MYLFFTQTKHSFTENATLIKSFGSFQSRNFPHLVQKFCLWELHDGFSEGPLQTQAVGLVALGWEETFHYVHHTPGPRIASCSDTFAASNIHAVVMEAGAVITQAEMTKISMYCNLDSSCSSYPWLSRWVAPLGQKHRSYPGHETSSEEGDPRGECLPLHNPANCCGSGNAASVLGTLGNLQSGLID